MTLTVYLARFFGVYIAVMGIVMIVRREAMLQLMSAFIDQRPLIFVLAMLRVLIGLAVVLAHNEWRGTVAIVVSLIGWITLLRGIALMLLPADTERKVLVFFERGSQYHAAAIIAIVFGLWLSYASFAV
jgi:hypothetical protein